MIQYVEMTKLNKEGKMCSKLSREVNDGTKLNCDGNQVNPMRPKKKLTYCDVVKAKNIDNKSNDKHLLVTKQVTKTTKG